VREADAYVYRFFSGLDRFTIGLRISLSGISILSVALSTLVSSEFLAPVSQLGYINLAMIFRSSLNFHRACRYRDGERKGFGVAYAETDAGTAAR
jgi:hypothetical protein